MDATQKVETTTQKFFVLKLRDESDSYVCYSNAGETYTPVTDKVVVGVLHARRFRTEEEADHFRYIGHVQSLVLDVVEVTLRTEVSQRLHCELPKLTQNQISDFWEKYGD